MGVGPTEECGCRDLRADLGGVVAFAAEGRRGNDRPPYWLAMRPNDVPVSRSATMLALVLERRFSPFIGHWPSARL